MQPLDVGVFSSVKTEWRKILKEHLISSDFKDINKSQFNQLFIKLTEKAFNRGDAIKGFEKTGIFPLNLQKMLSSVDPVEHRKSGKRASGRNDISSSSDTDASIIVTKKNRVKRRKITDKRKQNVFSNNDSDSSSCDCDSSSCGCDSSSCDSDSVSSNSDSGSCETESTSSESECSTKSQRNKENKKDNSFGKALKESIEGILTPKNTNTSKYEHKIVHRLNGSQCLTSDEVKNFLEDVKRKRQEKEDEKRERKEAKKLKKQQQEEEKVKKAIERDLKKKEKENEKIKKDIERDLKKKEKEQERIKKISERETQKQITEGEKKKRQEINDLKQQKKELIKIKNKEKRKMKQDNKKKREEVNNKKKEKDQKLKENENSIKERKKLAKQNCITNQISCYNCQRHMNQDDTAGIAITLWRVCMLCDSWFCGNCNACKEDQDDKFLCNYCILN